MIIYRLSSAAFKDDLSGTGAKLFGGRWNSMGLAALYTTEHISLAVLEVLVHLKVYSQPFDYHLVSIEIPATATENMVTIDRGKLKPHWKDDITYTQFIGDGFLNGQQSLLLKVPSAIVDAESNFIVNPAHPDSKKLKILSTKVFMFDKRLYLKNE